MAVLVLLAAAGCSGGSSSGGAPNGGAAQHARLVESAHLRPCPPSSVTTVSGGLPNVTLACLGHGPAVHLAGLLGKPTVVNVWAAWCIPCQKEAGILSSVDRSLHGRVRFLGVDTEDTAGDALDFGMHVNPPIRYPSVVDEDKKVLIGLARSPGPPETAFVDAAGKLVFVHTGPYDSVTELRDDVATYLHVRR